ncbi:MAG: flavin monoamine oxidase family protein [Methylovirgula sp.]
MAQSIPNAPPLADYDVVVIGAGAAGLAAGRQLARAGLKFLIVEARDRIGGRAFTVHGALPLDLGAGWLHSADVNPFTSILSELGFTIDKTPPAWGRHSIDLGFSVEEQASFARAIAAFHERVAAATALPDVPTAKFLEPGNRFNPLIAAVTTYASGVEPEKLSAHDLANYADTHVNWRVAEGYGTGIVRFGEDLPVTLSCPVSSIDHSGPRLRIITARGTILAERVIVTLPTNLLAEGGLAFDPPLPEKTAAAAALPLGFADKVVLALDKPANLPKDGHLFGRIDRTDTASYHLRPFGRNLIEAYFGGQLAADLESDGPEGLYAFAEDELADLLGTSFRLRLRRLAETAWGKEPFSRGAYSYALPGHVAAREKLAASVDDRLFFAGEACSKDYFSTAHGAYLTGLAAAEAAIKAKSGGNDITAR